ncbi:hypothetical protein GGI08_005437, partial [Coemansia sp. S2]
MSALLFPKALAARRVVGQVVRATATGHSRHLHRNAKHSSQTFVICNQTTQIDKHAACRLLSTTVVRADDQPTARSEEDRTSTTVLTRKQALADLAECATTSNAAAAYRIVCTMRQQQLLQNKAGCTTHEVLSDTQVTLALVSVLKRQYMWEDCLNCLNLVLNVRPELLGKEYTDKRFTRVGNASLKDVDPSLFRALIDA